MLTVYGIETRDAMDDVMDSVVATVLTVYGIETNIKKNTLKSQGWLQQCLPFTVLKHINSIK